VEITFTFQMIFVFESVPWPVCVYTCVYSVCFVCV